MPQSGWTNEEIYLLAERGYAFYRQGSYQEAGIIFGALVALDPSNAYCRTALAALCMVTGDYRRAVEELSSVLQQNPANHSARARRCEAQCELRNWDKVREDMDILRRAGQRQFIERLTWRMQAAGNTSKRN
jgi:tetratricopeptide (TPR) repeat protein